MGLRPVAVLACVVSGDLPISLLMQCGTGPESKGCGTAPTRISSKCRTGTAPKPQSDTSYTDWVHLNEPSRLVERLSGLREVDLADYTEAIGDLMDLHIVATHGPEAADEAYSFLTGDNNILPRIETSLPTSDLAPPVHFHGRSRQLVLSFVRGVVRLTSDTPPEVRWTIVIRYSGEDRWRLEGVQVGGRGSRRGLFGVSLAVSCLMVDMDRCRAGGP